MLARKVQPLEMIKTRRRLCGRFGLGLVTARTYRRQIMCACHAVAASDLHAIVLHYRSLQEVVAGRSMLTLESSLNGDRNLICI